MGRIKYALLALLLCFTFVSCEESVDAPRYTVDQTDVEALLTSTWKYKALYVDGEYFIAADSVMNPAKGDLNRFGGARAYLFRREIQYREDGHYQLLWEDRGQYALGTHGDPNDQPNFGSWRIDESSAQHRLIHNAFTDQETVYTIELTDTSFVCSHIRYMSRSSSECGAVQAYWDADSYVHYVEHFVRVK